MNQFNGFYHDENMSLPVYNWIRSLECELAAYKKLEEEIVKMRNCNDSGDADGGFMHYDTMLEILLRLEADKGKK